MTMTQLRYAVVLSQSISIKEAAKKLFISQPGLSAAMKELEEELGFLLFDRNNRGIHVTTEGAEFLGYAKQVLGQFELLEKRYTTNEKQRSLFSVSMQHYVFAVHAFIETVKQFPKVQYDFSVYETKTYEVLRDVRDAKSEIGILSYSKSNEKIVRKILKEYQLVFHPLMQREAYIYLWKGHPLAEKEELSLGELSEYPCISFEQDNQSEFHLQEEALGFYNYERTIKTNDRATSMEILAGLNGYTVGTGIASSSVLSSELVSIKLKEEDPLTIGYILRKGGNLSPIAKQYIEELTTYKEI